ncbi:MAG: hypothetical protein WC860_03520 [Candidatus Margulisiibacteriota bacterium]|jgi:hypothetical protein
MSSVALDAGFKNLALPHNLGKAVEVKQVTDSKATGLSDVANGDVVITITDPITKETKVYNVGNKAEDAAQRALSAASVTELTVNLTAMKP